jgi:carnitine-CoA ligase
MTGAVRHPHWFDPGLPQDDASVLSSALEGAAASDPDKTFIVFDGGETWTYGETLERVRKLADALIELGVGVDDNVAVLLGSTREMLLSWFAVAYCGAILVPINTALRGGVLTHVLENSRSRLLIAEPALCAALGRDDRTLVDAIAVWGEAAEGEIALGPLVAGQVGKATRVDRRPWDIHAIMYTSGTTGPSKGVICSYLHTYTIAMVAYGYMAKDDRILVNMPLFHVTGFTSVYAALLRRASMAMIPGFSASRFWDQIRAFECTTTAGMVGSLTAFLAKNEPRSDDREHGMTLAIAYPIDDAIRNVAHRHGFGFFTGFGMTEVPMPIVSDVNGGEHGESGRPRSGVDCRVVDENDLEVPAGVVGELVVRADLPWVLTPGYFGNDEATAKAWRNGWFHTGDAFRKDDAGRFYFVDRIKDSIRRRGENISSHEVEREILAHPSVRDVAVVPVRDEGGDDEVMAVIEVVSGTSIDYAELTQFLIPRMAYFMVPRYVRIVDQLPRTETSKVKKQQLRAEGPTPDTWDREAAGIRLTRASVSLQTGDA